jgi:hypothetical protein
VVGWLSPWVSSSRSSSPPCWFPAPGPPLVLRRTQAGMTTVGHELDFLRFFHKYHSCKATYIQVYGEKQLGKRLAIKLIPAHFENAFLYERVVKVAKTPDKWLGFTLNEKDMRKV